MSRPIYRRGKPYAAKMKKLLYYAQHPEHDRELDRYLLALVETLRTRLTRRELECLCAYYLCGQNMVLSARNLDVDPSTVSRNIRRGEAKLDQLIRLAQEISPIRFESAVNVAGS